MSQPRFAELSNVEQSFLINAAEHDILPGVYGDLDEAERQRPHTELAEILLRLVDRDWVQVRRYVSSIDANGQDVLDASEPIDRNELPRLLNDVTTWDYWHHFPSWDGAPILTLTDAGLRIWRGSQRTE